MKHYQEKLSEFINHELSIEDRQIISEHLLNCRICRKEYDKIKFGAALAARLQQADTPQNVWNEIENALNQKSAKPLTPIDGFSFFNSRRLPIITATFLLICLTSVIYFTLSSRRSTPQLTENIPASNQTVNTERTDVAEASRILTNQNTNFQVPAKNNSSLQIKQPTAKSNIQSLPKATPVIPNRTLGSQSNLPAWDVETIAGMPKTGNQVIEKTGKLIVGQFLETDANSRAKIQVANIGQVEISPNSRVQLVKTQSTEHRLSLEHGILQAKILAPPRLFIVDTPSAMAVDLGCAYKLEVDKEGNSRLDVVTGYVALEHAGIESIVPAGASCLTKRGKNLGTPFSENASTEFQNALIEFDFQNGGSAALKTIIKESKFYDAISLWHLLSKARETDREKVFDALAKYVPPPTGTTRAGILELNKEMLNQWWGLIESARFK